MTQKRRKFSGEFKARAQRMMNIETIHFSGQWDKYWEKERTA